MPTAWQEHWTFRIVDQDTGAAVPGVPVTVKDEPGAKGGHWVSDADGLVRIPKHNKPRLRLRVGLRAEDTIDLDARSLSDDPIPLAAPPRGADGPADVVPPHRTVERATGGAGARDKAGHLSRFARIGVLPSDGDILAVDGVPRETASVRYGLLFEIEQVWQSEGFSAGDVLYSLSLGPGDEAKVAVMDSRWRKKPDSRERPVQIVAKMVASPTVGDGLDAVPLEGFTVTDLPGALAECVRYLARRTGRAADALRRRPLGVSEADDDVAPGASLRTVRNMRSDGVLTYHFVEPVERFRVVTRTPHIRPAILVPFRLPNIATRQVLRRFGHALRRALLDRSLLPDIEQLLRDTYTPDPEIEGRLYAHITAHLSYYSATIIAAGDPLERAQALAKLRDEEGRPLADVIENVVVGRVGSYVAFPLRASEFAPPAWRAALDTDRARMHRASEETQVILPVRGVWMRVQLAVAMPEREVEMEEAEPEAKRGMRKGERGTAR